MGNGVVYITTLSELPVNISTDDGLFSLQDFIGSIALFFSTEETEGKNYIELKIKNTRSFKNFVYVITLQKE